MKLTMLSLWLRIDTSLRHRSRRRARRYTSTSRASLVSLAAAANLMMVATWAPASAIAQHSHHDSDPFPAGLAPRNFATKTPIDDRQYGYRVTPGSANPSCRACTRAWRANAPRSAPKPAAVRSTARTPAAAAAAAAAAVMARVCPRTSCGGSSSSRAVRTPPRPRWRAAKPANKQTDATCGGVGYTQYN
jgi:hypothetical protein